MRLVCAQCGGAFERGAGHVNRSRAIGAPLYCGRVCAGLGRRKPEVSDDERRTAKAAYDKEYRERNAAARKEQKAEWYRRTRDPEKERIARQKRMPQHVEYCRRPEYKAYKTEYDKKYRADEYGPFAEAYMLLLDVERELRSQATKYERYVAKGYFTRNAQKRRRELWHAIQRKT